MTWCSAVQWDGLLSFNFGYMLTLCPSGSISLTACVRGFLFDRGFDSYVLITFCWFWTTKLPFLEIHPLSPIPWMASIPLGTHFVLWSKFLYHLWHVMVGASALGPVHPFHDCMPLILCPCTRLFCLDNSVWCINDTNCYRSLVLFTRNHRMHTSFLKFKRVSCISFVNLNIIFKIIQWKIFFNIRYTWISIDIQWSLWWISIHVPLETKLRSALSQRAVKL